MDGVTLYRGDCLEVLRGLEPSSIDAVVTDPPYPEIDRDYGRLTEPEWHALMRGVVAECRRVLKPTGSAVFVLQPNSERVGRMRPWLWEFMAWVCRDWNMVQDAWWWNPTAPPTVHVHRTRGGLRPSVKACVWAGEPDCYRNQDAVLWRESDAAKAAERSDRALHRFPSGLTVRRGRCVAVADERGGVTPFNLLPIPNSNSVSSGGAHGHGAATPMPLCEWWVKYISPPSGTVLDPFMGSGTVGLAAIEHGREFVGVEQDEHYFGVAKKRIEAARESAAAAVA